METFSEKRVGKQPIPNDLKLYLTPFQMSSLNMLEESGWLLWFVRRSYYQDALPVLIDKDHEQTAIIDKAGMVETSHGFEIRGKITIH